MTDLAARPWPCTVAALGGCLKLVVANSGRFIGTMSPFVPVRDVGRGWRVDRGRVNDLGGTVDIASRPGQGTEVEKRIPRPIGG